MASQGVLERQKPGKEPSPNDRFDGFLYLLKKGALPYEIAVLRITLRIN